MTPIFGTNWKMRNVLRDEARAYVRNIATALSQMGDTRIFILPPVTLIRDMVQECPSNQIVIGAQNFHWAHEGEFTGEISTNLLKQEGAQILLGRACRTTHSLRRIGRIISRKLKRALGDDFQVVLCVGDAQKDIPAETLQKTFLRQIGTALDGIAKTAIPCLIVAYEPI
jgi:triosephosphate isomerase